MNISDSITPKPPRPGWLYDGRWTRMMVVVLKLLPTGLCVFLTNPVTLVIYLLAQPKGAAVRANLGALFPEWGLLRRWFAGYRVFRQFALTYVDRMLIRHCGRKVEWEVEGMSTFEDLRNEPGGVLVFTVHSGNYDVGASLLAEGLGRPLHTVRVPERTQSMEELRALELNEAAERQPLLRCHYNKPGGHLGIDLCRLLLAGEVVAVQGDRVLMDVTPLEIVHEGVKFTIPLGPLMLAETSRAPCYGIFSNRTGLCRYRIEIGEPFYPGSTRMRRVEIAALWLPVMVDFLRRHWDQWFVFERMLERVEPPPET